MDPPPHTRNSSLTPPDRTTVPYALQHSPSPSPVQRSASVSRPVSQQQQTTQPRRPSKTGPTQRVASASGSTCGLNYSPGDLDVGPASRSMEGFSGSFQGKEDVRKLAQRLATRLQYAAFKVERGWTKHSLSEVENLYWRASKARSNGPPVGASGTSAFASSSGGQRNSFKESLEMAQNRRRISNPRSSNPGEPNGTAGPLLPGFSYQTEVASRSQASSHRPTPPVVIRRSSSQQSQYAPSVNVRIKRYSPELARHLQQQKRRRTHSHQSGHSAEEDADADDEEDDIFGGRPNVPHGEHSSPESHYTQLREDGGHVHGGSGAALASDGAKTARKVSGGSVLGPAGVPTPPPSAGTIDESSRSGSGASTSLLRSNNPSHLRASPTRNTQAHAQTQSRGQTPSSGRHVLQAGPSPFTSGTRPDSSRSATSAMSPPTYADFWSKLASGSGPSPSKTASASPEKSSRPNAELLSAEGSKEQGREGDAQQARSQSVDRAAMQEQAVSET